MIVLLIRQHFLQLVADLIRVYSLMTVLKFRLYSGCIALIGYLINIKFEPHAHLPLSVCTDH